MADFNREMLTLAREYRGLTQTKLAEHAAMAQADISKFETGIKIPSEEQLRRLAFSLRLPIDFFSSENLSGRLVPGVSIIASARAQPKLICAGC